MTAKCECSAPGYCERRKCVVPKLHWRKCRAGNCEAIDAIYLGTRKTSVAHVTTRPPATPGKKQRVQYGVGTIVERKIHWLTAISPVAKASCNCVTLRDEMNRNGPVWCENQKEVLAARIAQNAAQMDAVSVLGIPVPQWLRESAIGRASTVEAAKLVIQSAVNEFRKTKNGKPARRRARRGRPFDFDPGTPLPPLPFTAEPRLTLIFHVWPQPGWRRHIEKLRQAEGRFHRKLMGIAVGPNGESAEAVKAEFPGWEFHEFRNNPHSGEYETLTWGISKLSEDVNEVAFYAHAKGVRPHTVKSEAVMWWTDTMYETVLYNVDEVLSALEDGAAFVGSFRDHRMQCTAEHKWHFAGTYYAFRPAIVLPKRIPVQKKYYGTESWPGDNVQYAQSACMFAEDLFLELYNPKKQPRAELKAWREARNGVPLRQATADVGREYEQTAVAGDSDHRDEAQ